MKVNNSTAVSGNFALTAAGGAKKAAVGAFEKNAKEFGPIAASAIGLGSAAANSNSTLGKVVNSVENGIKEVANNTVALASDSVQEVKSAYNKVYDGASSAASAVAGYADTGLSAGVQAISALV